MSFAVLCIVGGIFVIVAGKIIVGSCKYKKKIKNIFEKGKLKYGKVIAYTDGDDNRYEDESHDCIYDGSNATNTSYTSVVLRVFDENVEKEVIIDSYGTEDGTDVLLSNRFPLGMQVGFYEYGEDRRFATDKWLDK